MPYEKLKSDSASSIPHLPFYIICTIALNFLCALSIFTYSVGVTDLRFLKHHLTIISLFVLLCNSGALCFWFVLQVNLHFLIESLLGRFRCPSSAGSDTVLKAYQSIPLVFVLDPEDQYKLVYASKVYRPFVNEQSTTDNNDESLYSLFPQQSQHWIKRVNRQIVRKGYATIKSELRITPGQRIKRESLINRIESDDQAFIVVYVYDAQYSRGVYGNREPWCASPMGKRPKHLYEEVFDNLLDVFFLVEVLPDDEFIIVGYNRAAEEMTGLSRHEVIGKPKKNILPEAIHQAFIYHERKCRDTAQAICFEEQLTICRRSYLAEATLVPLLDENKKVIRIACIVRDITEKRRMENQLEIQAQDYRRLVENSPDTICRHDLAGRRIYMNPQLALLSAGQEDRMLLTSPLDFPGGPEGQKYHEKISETINSGQTTEFELTWRCSGEPHCMLMKLVPERDANGSIISVLAIGRDITVIKSISQQLEASTQKMKDLIAYREKARETERKYIAREIHDELGQQLTGLRLLVQGISLFYKDKDPELTHQIDTINSHLNSTIQFVRNLVSRLRPSVLDMGLNAALEWLAFEFYERSGIRCQFQEYGQSLDLDETVLITVFRVVQESLTNVMKHAEASQVFISVCQLDGYLSVQVSDDGIGFDVSKMKSQSYGLEGITERIESLDGEFFIYSSPDCGSSLEITIPLQQHH